MRVRIGEMRVRIRGEMRVRFWGNEVTLWGNEVTPQLTRAHVWSVVFALFCIKRNRIVKASCLQIVCTLKINQPSISL